MFLWTLPPKALNYAADNGAYAASCSWGSSETDALRDAINYFIYGSTEADTSSNPKQRLIFKAAGNDGTTDADYMCSRTDIISVAGTNETDSEYSNTTYGDWVDISAPATDIYSTYHDNGNPDNDAYASLTGTSMATPIAASVASLIASHNPYLSADEVEQMLYDTADNIDDHLSSEYIGKMGAGRVNAYEAVYQADVTLPVTLASFEVRQGNGLAVLQWRTASEIQNIGFNVWRRSDSSNAYARIASYKEYETLSGLGTSSEGRTYRFVDCNIQNGQTYWYKIEDVDINGNTRLHGPVEVQPLASSPLTEAILNAENQYSLGANYPNPFNPSTRFVLNIPSNLEKPQPVNITIINARGQRVKKLFSGRLSPGAHLFQWEGLNNSGQPVASGAYFYVVNTPEFREIKKMLLLR